MNQSIEKELIIAHINMLQTVIGRMAKNSENCKIWCLALLGGVLTFCAQLQKPYLVFGFIIPLIAFAILDAYYLSIEREIIEKQQEFLNKYQTNQLAIQDLFQLGIESRRGFWGVLKGLECIISPSVYIFYSMLSLALWFIIK